MSRPCQPPAASPPASPVASSSGPSSTARHLHSGTSDYIASPELMQTVNVAVRLERPLLIKGERGTGKTMLAQSIDEIDKADLESPTTCSGSSTAWSPPLPRHARP